MSLIKCSECGKEISDKATACVHCGCPVSKSSTEQKGFDLNETFGDMFGNAKLRTVKVSNEQKNTNDVNATARTGGTNSLTGTIIAAFVHVSFNICGTIIALIVGLVCLIVDSDLNLLLFGMIPLSLKTVGAIFLIIGIVLGIVTLAKKRNK